MVECPQVISFNKLIRYRGQRMRIKHAKGISILNRLGMVAWIASVTDSVKAGVNSGT